MAITLSCLDLGTVCDHKVSGDSIAQIVADMCRHAITVHGRTEEFMHRPETQQMLRAAVRQSTRPAHLRTTKVDI
jgi:predicted small metal-binding protein